MRDFRGIIKALGGPSEFARLVGLKQATHATNMSARDSIPPRYWPRVIEIAAQRGVRLTHDDLHAMRARRFSGEVWSPYDIAPSLEEVA